MRGKAPVDIHYYLADAAKHINNLIQEQMTRRTAKQAANVRN